MLAPLPIGSQGGAHLYPVYTGCTWAYAHGGPSLGLPLPTDLTVSASHTNQRKPGSSMPPQLVDTRLEVPVGGTGEQDGWQAESLGRE